MCAKRQLSICYYPTEKAITTTEVMIQILGMYVNWRGLLSPLIGHRIEFPTFLVLVSFLSLIATSLGFDNNSRLINGQCENYLDSSL